MGCLDAVAKLLLGVLFLIFAAGVASCAPVFSLRERLVNLNKRSALLITF